MALCHVWWQVFVWKPPVQASRERNPARSLYMGTTVRELCASQRCRQPRLQRPMLPITLCSEEHY